MTALRRTLLVACLLAVAACGKKTDPSAPAPANKVYVVGTDAAYAPFESQNEKGEIVGFDIDIVRAVAAKAGIAVQFVNTPWEGIFNALNQGDRDIVASAVTITPERRATLDFTAPYFDARQLIVVRDSNAKVSSFNDLKGLKVGVQTGTTGDEAVSKLLGKSSTDVRRFEATPLALRELDVGGVDAVVADNGVVIHHVANNPGGKFRTITDAGFTSEQYGIAVKKGNAALLSRLDAGLAAIRADGSYDAIHARWFGAK